jgi:hypothetical protein
MSHYLRSVRLGENSYATNVSPGRRNIRRGTIYDSDSSQKRKHFGRVMPSEWPDGGHDAPVGSYTLLTPFLEPAILARGPAGSAATAPMRISNAGRFFSAAELGNVYDPVMWFPAYGGASGPADSQTLNQGAQMPASRNVWPDVSNASNPSANHGGGNTLRIGRPEHQKFDAFEKPGMRASHLLDIFHVGMPESQDPAEWAGALVEIHGHVNVNTASEDVLRALAAGMLRQDPELRRVTNRAHEVSNGRFAPRSQQIELGTPAVERAADRVARAIIASRPFATAADLALARDVDGELVFGNRRLYEAGENLEWSDAAAEEVFGRVHDAATFRSRNFRVWVVGQSIAGSWESPQVLAESRKVFTVFADPGERNSDGSIIPENTRVRITYENHF